MNSIRERFAVIIAAVSLGFSGFLFINRPANDLPGSPGSNAAASDETVAEMRQSLVLLEAEIEALKNSAGAAEGANGPVLAAMDERFQAMEQSVARLQSAFDGISLEEASADRAALFVSDEGAIKADEYFEAKKYAIAAEGYMAYYNSHPDDPDAQSILKKARDAYQRSGYDDMAVWVQEKMMEIFPESRHKDLMTLAAMNKTAGNYDQAVAHSLEAAELTANPQERLWNRLYWAWYSELRDGPSAGMAAVLEVQREIEAAGFSDHRLNERAQEKIDELKAQISATGQ